MANELIQLKMGNKSSLSNTTKKAGQLLFARDLHTEEEETIYDREYLYLDRDNSNRVKISAEHSDTTDSLFTPVFIDGHIFDGSSDINHYGICTSLESDVTKIVNLTTSNSAEDVSFTEGSMVFVKMANSNTANNPEMNVNGTGSYDIVFNDITIPYYSWEPGSIVGFVYQVVNRTPQWQIINQSDNPIPIVYCPSGGGVANKTAYCKNYSSTNLPYKIFILQNSNTSNNTLTLSINSESPAKEIYINGEKSHSTTGTDPVGNYDLPAGVYILYGDDNAYYINKNGILPGKINNAINADIAEKANKDSLGHNIASTYAVADFSFDPTNHNFVYINGTAEDAEDDQTLNLPFVLQAGDTMSGKLIINDVGQSALSELFEVKRSYNSVTTNYFKVLSSKITSDLDLEIGKTGSGHSFKVTGTIGSIKLYVDNTTGADDRGIQILNGSSEAASITYTTDSTNGHKISFNLTNGSRKETFQLPAITSTTSGSPVYNILTTKNLVAVNQGGTGVDNLTAKGVLYGNGTSAISATSAPSKGSILIGSSAVTPVPAWFDVPSSGFGLLSGNATTGLAWTKPTTAVNDTNTNYSILLGNTSGFSWLGNPSKGSLLIGSEYQSPTWLDPGSNGKVLMIQNGVPSWQTVQTSSPLTFATANRLYYPNTTNATSLEVSNHYIDLDQILINQSSNTANTAYNLYVNGTAYVSSNFTCGATIQGSTVKATTALILPTTSSTTVGALWIG